MNIEDSIFKKTKVNYNDLIKYGFIKDKNNYKYSTNINNDFRVDIIVDEKGAVKGKVIDINFNEEYVGFRFDNALGEFASRIKNEYINILKDIRDNCFKVDLFFSKSANELVNVISKKYGDMPEFLWDKYPDFGVFKNKNNGKWYGIIMNLDYTKLDKKLSGMVDILNVKLPKDMINNLLVKEGYYPAYHMNKNNWITITLDGKVKMNKIMELLDISHEFTVKGKEWIVPANLKYYDVISNLEKAEDNIINWKQSSKIEVGDIIYMYVAQPYSCILYKFRAVEVDIPYNKKSNLKINKVMRIKLIKKYDKDKYNMNVLKKNGIVAVRGPRLITSSLSKLLNMEE